MTDEQDPLAHPGTGGLTLGPPQPRGGEADNIGFAPDLLSSAEAPLAEHDATEEIPDSAPAQRYPRAAAAIDTLLGELNTDDKNLEPDAPVVDALERPPLDSASSLGAASSLPDRLELGPSITRPTPAVRRPPSDAPEPPAPLTQTSDQMEDLVEMVLVGGDESEAPSVHLVFKQDTFDGMYLKLERTSEGLFARFQVKDASGRRAVAGHVDMMLSRLRDRGLRIAGHEIVVED